MFYSHASLTFLCQAKRPMEPNTSCKEQQHKEHSLISRFIDVFIYTPTRFFDIIFRAREKHAPLNYAKLDNSGETTKLFEHPKPFFNTQ